MAAFQTPTAIPLGAAKKDIPDLDIFPFAEQKIEQTRGLRRLLFRILPYHTLGPLKYELRMALVRLQALPKAHTYKGCQNLLVNVGAGAHGRDGWVNIDAHSAKNVSLVCDARKRLPFLEGAVKGIFVSTFLSISTTQKRCPISWSSVVGVLCLGGVLRIIVPDAEKYLTAYVEGGGRISER